MLDCLVVTAARSAEHTGPERVERGAVVCGIQCRGRLVGTGMRQLGTAAGLGVALRNLCPTATGALL